MPEAPHCNQLLPAFRTLHDAFRPGTVVLIPDAQELYDRRVIPYRLQVGSAPWATYANGQLDLAVKALTASGPTPVLLTNIPCNPEPATGGAFDAVMHDAVRRRAVDRYLATYARTHRATVTLVDLDGLLCPDGTPITSVAGRAVIDVHGRLTPDGAQYVWRCITERVAAESSASP